MRDFSVMGAPGGLPEEHTLEPLAKAERQPCAPERWATCPFGACRAQRICAVVAPAARAT